MKETSSISIYSLSKVTVIEIYLTFVSLNTRAFVHDFVHDLFVKNSNQRFKVLCIIFLDLPFSPRCPYETASKQSQMVRNFHTKSSQTTFRCPSCNKFKFGISRQRNAISQAEECRGLFLKLVIIYTELYFSLSLPTRVYLTFLILGTEYYMLKVYQKCFYNYVTYRHVDGTSFCVSNSERDFLNFYGAQVLISRNQFRQSVQPGGPV